MKTQKQIKKVKDVFEKKLAESLKLTRVTAPRFIRTIEGLQDDLAGTQIPVSFKTKFGETLEVVHSLAKWKRYTLGKYKVEHGKGIYTDMDAIRKDEEVDEIHSIYVDQWDWERVISKEERSLKFLKKIVKKIYSAIKETAKVMELDGIKSYLPKEIVFVHSEDLEEMYPEKTPKEREHLICEKHGAVFLIGIGHPLKSGKPHDLRAADYDDWVICTKKESGKITKGLCGDILVWDKIREKSLELSSMGIRVDKESLTKQLEMCGLSSRKEKEFHKGILEEKLPLSIGGGIGQSRLCMFLLQKSHIGEVQSSIWPKSEIEKCARKGIMLL